MIRIFIGTEPKTYVAQRVLEFSIRSRTRSSVEIVPMIGPAWEYPLDGIKVGTGFSLRRWMIPAACDWQGRAIYMDADQLVLGDVQELWDIGNRSLDASAVPSTICGTRQPDKHYSYPVLQTSVMVLACDRARAEPWQFDLPTVLVDLRSSTKTQYIELMHANRSQPCSALPIGWNHLNVYEAGVTRLLHYTKEPEQPWYKPDHPLAYLWQDELKRAMAAGYVTVADIERGLAAWNVKEDWRNTNGLHPYYRRFVRGPRAVRPAKATAVKTPAVKTSKVPRMPVNKVRPLWVTSFGPDMYKASGKKLVESFVRWRPDGSLLCGAEGFTALPPDRSVGPNDKVQFWDLTQHSPELRSWLITNASVIPKHLGGEADGVCRCEGGPYDVHDKRHVMPCLGHWFNRNASRWYRKIIAQEHALQIARLYKFTHLIWLDSDCMFRCTVSRAQLQSWFGAESVFYLRNKRPIMEAGVLGFDLTRGGEQLLETVAAMYRDGSYRDLPRWDDSAVYQHCMTTTGISRRDIATSVGPHARVVEHSLLTGFISHDKGRHGRKLGIMT